MLLIMPILNPHHPASIVVRVAGHGARIARRLGQDVLGVFFGDAIHFGAKAEEVSREIAADAAALGDEIAAAGADGVFTPAECARLRALAAEIEREAITGEPIAGPAEGRK